MSPQSRSLRFKLILLLAVSIPSPVLVADSAIAASPPLLLRLSGEATGDRFGSSVAAAGDVNGDGYGDVIVSSLGTATISDPRGRVYVFLGGPGADSIPDVMLREPPVIYPIGYGELVAGAGDVNGDGYNDVMVSAPLSGNSGRVYVYYGGPAMDGEADWILADRTIVPQMELFGLWASSAGDLNGDGFGDIVVGAPWWSSFPDYPSVRPGRALIFFGGSHPGDLTDLVLDSPSIPMRYSEDPQQRFGRSVAAAGDVDGDGYSDLIVQEQATSDDYGRAFIFHGGPAMDGLADQALKMTPFGNYLNPTVSGPAVSSAGDFNADGYGDVAVAAPIIYAVGDGTAATSGRVYVYLGGQTVDPDPVPYLVLEGDNSDFSFGGSIAGGQDLNGDGYPDLLIGAPFNNFDGHRRGRVYVYYGGASADSVPDVILDGELDGSHFGEHVSMGDVNGDGVADAIIAAPSFPAGPATDPGHVYVYDLSIPLAAHASLRGEQRTIPLNGAASQVCVQLEPTSGDYQNLDVDLSSIRLVSPGTGAVGGISPVGSKRTIEGDNDGDGIAELSACFERSDFARLFSSVRGRRTVEVALEGRLKRGRKIRAPFTMTVLGTGKPDEVVASVAPNPMNPQATLTFTLRTTGDVTVKLYDVSGRLVRTVAERQAYPAGTHGIRIDGRDDRGMPLASGVYFYRVESPDGQNQGRVVVAK